jgi:mono/diheme cytochrome c family protein
MKRRMKLSSLGLTVRVTVILCTASFGLGSLAQEGHQHSHAPASAKQLKNPLTATAENNASGRALFMQHCATCHGADGRAMTEMAAMMKIPPADLTALPGRTDGEIYWVISNGIRPSGMPAFESKMSEQERWQAALYVKQLVGEHPNVGTQHDEHAGHQTGQTKPSPPKTPAQTAQSAPGAAHQHAGESGQKPTAQAATGKQNTMHAGGTGHDMSNMEGGAHAGHSMMNMMTTVTGGPFRSMQAIGSGTALQPASTIMSAWHWMPNNWMLMVHGDLKLTYNQQGGPRGVGKAESMNWLMVMAERKAGPGQLMLRGMFSAEPLTTPHGGFPLLFQTGETYRGRPIVDAQHPHNLLMELAASYTVPLSESVSFQVYGGPVAEPALGPVAFMHRASASENPAAPLGHHWQDSTHITFGVITGALTVRRFKFEVSGFHGAEPGENRAAIDVGTLDSYSFRTWFTPTHNWAMQFSYGHLTGPEAISPSDLDRMTASVAYNRPFTNGSWASTLVWGRNSEEHGRSNSYLLESTLNFQRKNHLYTRMELIDKQGLLIDNIFGRRGLIRAPMLPLTGHLPEEFERSFRVAAFTFGGVRDFVESEKLRVGLGADVTFYNKPPALAPIYGKSPVSFHLFLRFRPGDMR